MWLIWRNGMWLNVNGMWPMWLNGIWFSVNGWKRFWIVSSVLWVGWAEPVLPSWILTYGAIGVLRWIAARFRRS
jgi:hypothetical protein